MDTARSFDRTLDITRDVCPLTFVKARLLIESMSSGQTARIRLYAGEPLENVPRSLQELGHEILAITAEEPGSSVYTIDVRKA